jgi:peptidoglycan/LPS O-acetylase OafA/YrhL
MYFILTSLTFFYYKIDPSFKPDTYFLSTPEASTFTVYLLNITFLRGFLNDVALSGIGQGWTLTVEECFYILAPFILLVKSKVPLLIHVIVFYLIGFTLVYLCKDINFLGLFQTNKFMLITTFFGRSLEFYVGIQLAVWYKNNKISIPGCCYTYLGILSVLLIVCLLIFTKDANAEHYLGLYSSTGLIINNFLLPFAIGLLFLGLLRERTVVRKILESRLAVLLGKSSYVFYLIHMGLISELMYRYITHNYILNFPLLVFLSILLYKFLESPLNNIIRKI